MLDVVFGYSKPEFATIYTGLVMKALYPFFVINPAVAAVNFIPFLRHLPSECFCFYASLLDIVLICINSLVARYGMEEASTRMVSACLRFEG